MTSTQCCSYVQKQRRDIAIKLTDNVLCSRRNLAKRPIVLVQEFVIETIAKNFSGTLFDFANVDEHPGCGIDRTGKDEIGDAIAAAAIPRICFRSKRGRVLLFSPTGDVQASRCRKFEAFADGQQHEVTPLAGYRPPLVRN